MTRIYLIRHGHVDNPTNIFYGPETPLSTRGQIQITKLAEDFIAACIRPDAIICSPYQRTRDTLSILHSHFPDASCSQDKRLEEWRVGDWEGKPLADFFAYTRYDKQPAASLPTDIEPLEVCAARIQTVIHETISRHPHKTTFLISHREPIACAISKYRNSPWEKIHELPIPVASAWESVFDNMLPQKLEPRFDRSSFE